MGGVSTPQSNETSLINRREKIKALVSELLAVQGAEAREQDYHCHTKAVARGQQTFTLVEQDLSSPRTICFWIMENIETCSPEKLVDALLDAIAMRAYPNRKHAD